MSVLIACISSGKGTLGHVQKVISDHEWEKIILISTKEGKEEFSDEKNADFIVINPENTLSELIEELKLRLKEKNLGIEVSLNMISGSGKEHMALLSAVLQLGLGIRQVALTKDGIKEI